MSTAHGFGKLLRQLRIAADVSREELAEQSGISVKAIGALERGERTHPRQATVDLLVRALALGPSERAALVAAARSATRPEPSQTPRASTSLRVPIPPTPLIGREGDLTQARALLADGSGRVRLLTLVGPGGVGKTRLALALAGQVGPRYRDGAVFVDLAPVQDPASVVSAVAAALALTDHGSIPVLEALRRRLAARQLLLVIDNVERVIVGKRREIELALSALLARGHVLVEDVPGVGKTVLAKALARSFGGTFKRIQFTPDLLPADITGTLIFNPGERTFTPRLGPIFANLVLADEINRAPAKVQSALLEAMQERQVTIGDTSYTLPDPFVVIATQNPIEHEGTYALPEAQVDRFVMKLKVDYPTAAEETRMLSLYLDPTYTDIISFGLLVVVLVARPAQLVGRA